MSPPARRRPALGLLLNSVFGGFEEALWKGVVEAAAEQGVDLVCFLAGGRAFDVPGNELLDLIGPETLDGLIVVAGAVGWFSGPAPAAERLRRLDALPTVSLSREAAGATSLLVDNAAGIRRALAHLVRDHGRRRVAFLRGPEGNPDADARMAAYLDGLGALSLPVDPALVVEGDFGRHTSARAVRELLASGVGFDALLSSNDGMALAALDELERAGRRVPHDVAVIGFDDVPEAAGFGLSTIRQPMREMGRAAVRLLLERLRGEAPPARTVFPAHPVLRATCGCDARGPGAWRPPASLARCASAAALAAELARAFPELGERLGDPGWPSALAEAALAGAPPAGDHPLPLACEALVRRGLPPVVELGEWLRVVRCALEPLRHGAPEAGHRAAALGEAAQERVALLVASEEVRRRARTEEEMRVLRRLVEPLPLPDDAFQENLLRGLPALGMRSFFLTRYLSPDRQDVELVAHFDLDGAPALEGDPPCLPARELVAGRFAGRRRAYVVLPIRSPAELLGFALCEIGPMSPSNYELLMHEISTVLGVNGLMDEVRAQHRRLLDTARQAGMAEVAVGALHNVGNLLTSVGVSVEELQESARAAQGSGLLRATALLAEHAGDLPGFFARDPRAAVLPAYLGPASDQLARELERVASEAAELIQKTGLVRDSIRALQDHARGGREHLLHERFDPGDLVRAAVEIQRPHLERLGVEVRLELDKLPPVLAPRSKLVHVLVNLLKNAAEAMGATPEDQRRIHVRGRACPEGVRLEVQDTGEGIPPEGLARIFTYGYTTKRDGHGFGLHTCANYMKQLGGSIAAASPGPGRGATFTLVIPAPPAEEGRG